MYLFLVMCCICRIRNSLLCRWNLFWPDGIGRKNDIMLKGKEWDIGDLANRSNMNNFIHFKFTLRDKLYFELGVIKTNILHAFENKEEKFRKVIYACNTKWIYNQTVPPGYDTGFTNYNYKENI